MSINDVMNRAIALRNRGRGKEAIRVLAPEMAALRHSAPGSGLLATLYWEESDWKKAADWFGQTVKLSPRSERASLGLFQSLWDLGKVEEAFDEMRRFLVIGESEEYKRVLREILQEKRTESGSAIAASELPLEERFDVNFAERAGLEWRKSNRLTRLSSEKMQHA
ncbi:MAG TPA: hypothetical protein VM008_10535 [Phycisphaerae bacterium]|nr:hypothetical protein [Phycisphaerae bacterium]